MMKTITPETLLLLSLAIGAVPLLVGVGTCYLKFSIVLSMLRSGFGTQQAPSASLVLALSMVMSLTVMQPVIRETSEKFSSLRFIDLRSVSLQGLIAQGRDLSLPWLAFLRQHSGERELQTFQRLCAGVGDSEVARTDSADISLTTALGAFVLSEIKHGFIIAFVLLLPFFVIDLIVGNILIAMGLTMMSPSTISLPLKLLLFVSSDGWLLLAKGLISAYR